MTQFLHVQVEDIDLLIPAFQIHEVVDLEHTNSPGDGHALWRGKVINQFDVGLFLERSNTTRTRKFGVVYGPDHSEARPVLMRIHQVLGLKNPRRDQLHPLPGISSMARRLFDAIWIDPQLGQKGYCLKSQLPPDFMNKMIEDQSK